MERKQEYERYVEANRQYLLNAKEVEGKAQRVDRLKQKIATLSLNIKDRDFEK